METQKDNAAQQLRMTLTAYAAELVNETPVLSRYTDVIPRPDHLGGYYERERDRVWHKNLKYSSNTNDLNSCISALTQFRDAPTLWGNLRGELLKSGNDWLAKELQYRRERRNANIENLLSAARKLAPEMPTDYEILSAMTAPGEDKQTEPEYDIAAVMQGVKDGTLEPPPTLPREATDGRTGSLDYRNWKCAATKFDNDTAGDVEYIRKVIADQLVAAYADYNDRLLQAGGKPFLKADAQYSSPPQSATETLELLNNKFSIIPQNEFAAMSFVQKVSVLGRFLEIGKRLEEIKTITKDGNDTAKDNGAKLDALQGKVNEMQTAANLAARNSAAAKRAAEQATQTTAELPAAIAETKAEATGAKVAAEGARAAAEKAAKKPTTIINAQPGATVTVAKPPRTDAGEKHGKTARGWRTQADMAADFSKSAKKICGKWYGKVTVAIVKDWETRYPDETKRERKSGYHAGLRNEPNPTPETKKAYCEAAANCNDYWKKHNAAFLTWLKTNPQGDHATFLKTWERPGKTVHRNDTDKTMRYGADTSLPDALDSGDFDNET